VMTTDEPHGTDRPFGVHERMARIPATIGVLIGAAVLSGWAFDIAYLKSVLPQSRPAQPATAVCLVLCGVAMGLATASSRSLRHTSISIAALVLLVAAATLVQTAFGLDFGTDTLLFGESVMAETSESGAAPGRMATASAAGFVLLSSALLFVRASTPLVTNMLLTVGTAGLLLACTAVVGHVFSVSPLHGFGLNAPVALPTALGAAALFTGVLAMRSQTGWIASLSGDGVGTRAVRSLGVFAIAAPLALGILLQTGTYAGVIDGELRTALIVLGSSIIAFAALLPAAARVKRAQHQQRQSHEREQQINAELRRAAHDARTASEDRERLQGQLLDAEQRKDEFLAILGHELRNPLAPIRYAIGLLKPGVPPEIAAAARDVIERQTNHMVRIVDDLLDMSRITRNTLELRLELLDLRSVITDAVGSARSLIEAAHHQLTLDLPPHPLPVRGDATRLAQTLGNLLNNAAKYTDPGGRIDVKAERRGPQLTIEVRDSGSGIAAEILPRIFDLFVQGHPTDSRAPSGLGIGLSLAKRLVEMHGGSIEAQSEGAGHGSVFLVRLPTAEEPAATEPSALAENVVPLFKARQRVLIVDDNLDAANSLAALLQLSGYVTHLAHDGLAALEIAEIVRPGAIILDIGMPKMNGHEAARRIRQQPWGKDTLLIAVSGWGQEEDRRKSKEAGFHTHLTKPVDATTLLTVLQNQQPGGFTAYSEPSNRQPS
jgi:signal transduction histidine kinase/ActR/RegA family two-component response regulator